MVSRKELEPELVISAPAPATAPQHCWQARFTYFSSVALNKTVRVRNILGLLVVLQNLELVVAVHPGLDVDYAQHHAVQRLLGFVHMRL